MVRGLIATANALLASQLILRWLESGHFPVSNLYESLCFLSWGATLAQLLVERQHLQPGSRPHHTAVSGQPGFASFALPDQLQTSRPPGAGPAFQLAGDARERDHGQLCRWWGSLLALGVLLADRGHGSSCVASLRGSGAYRQAAPLAREVLALAAWPSVRQSAWTTSATARSRWGFMLLTVGIVSGAVWANEAWGSYWSWIPRRPGR